MKSGNSFYVGTIHLSIFSVFNRGNVANQREPVFDIRRSNLRSYHGYRQTKFRRSTNAGNENKAGPGFALTDLFIGKVCR